MVSLARFAAATALGAFACLGAVAEEASSTPEAAPNAATAAETTALGGVITDAAAIYATYQSEVTDVRANPLSSKGDIDTALTNLGGHNPDRLSQGWLAYSALVASQSPEYRDAVRDIEGYYGRERLVTGMQNDLRYARSLAGGEAAVAAALTATESDQRRLTETAAYVKEQAYTLQGAGWAKAKIGNSGAKADVLNASSKQGIPAHPTVLEAFTDPEIETALVLAGDLNAASLWDNLSSVAPNSTPAFATAQLASQRSAPAIRQGRERIADRIATLAAYQVIGVGEGDTAQFQSALADRGTKGCINMAQLNLQQCVAAAHQHHELPFCISEHALKDIGDCIGDVAQ